MKLSLESIGDAFKAYYDRLIALLAIMALLAFLVLLIMRLGNITVDGQRFQEWKSGLRPEFADATNVTLEAFTRGHHALTNPFQVGEWGKKRLSIPEERVSCLDCGRPIPHEVGECTWCKAKIKGEVVSKDKDEDGILDEWELKYGLNPLDPDDARLDPDKDGFTNIEEYRFGTNPSDASSSPPVIAKLRVAEIRAMPFHLKFMAVNKLTTGDLFQINSTKSGKTSWYAMNQDVEGYVLSEFTPIIVEEASGGGKMMVKMDRSVLTLKSKISDRIVSLRKGEAVPVSEYEVRFILEIDGSEFSAKHGADFDLRGRKFTVKEVDNKESRVLIRDKESAKETWIGLQAETGAPPRKE